jgi:hypothetical protein
MDGSINMFGRDEDQIDDMEFNEPEEDDEAQIIEQKKPDSIVSQSVDEVMSAIFDEKLDGGGSMSESQNQMDVMTKQSSMVEAMSMNSSDEIQSDDDMDVMELASSSDESEDDIERDPNNQTITEKIG